MREALLDLIQLSLDAEKSVVLANAENTQDPYVRQLVAAARQREETLAGMVDAAFKALDKANLGPIISSIEQMVTDFPSAVTMRETCTIEWFKAQEVSTEGKCLIAEKLLEKCEPHLQKLMPSIWKVLAKRDKQTMLAVTLTSDDQE